MPEHLNLLAAKATPAQRKLLARVTGTETMQDWCDRGAPGTHRLIDRRTLLAMQARAAARANLRSVLAHAPWSLIAEPVQWEPQR